MIRTGYISAVAVAGLASAASAGPVVFELGNNFGAVDPSGPAPWATITIDDGGSANSATLTIQSSLNDPGEFWAAFYFNLDPNLDLGSLAITNTGGQAPVAGSGFTSAINIGPAKSYKADGGGYYDIAFGYEISNSANRFTGSESSTYNVSYTGAGNMVAQSFLFDAVASGAHGPFQVVGRVRGTGVGNQGSGWISTGGQPPVIPLPSAAAMGLFGLAGVGGIRRRNA